MRVALGCDHGGFPLKSRIRKVIESAGHVVVDCGTDSDCSVDYPDYARAVGIALLAANKIPGVRAGVCHDTYSAHQGVEHDDMNVLCIGARIVGEELAAELVAAFLKAAFTHEDRHVRRLKKVLQIEQEALSGKFPTS